MNTKLFFQATIKFLLGMLLVGITLFIPAHTLSYFNAWLLLCLLFIPMFLVGIILMIKNPELLKKRLNLKEEEKEQKEAVLYGAIMFLSGFIIAGLNYRYKWIELSDKVVIISSIIFVIAYLLYAKVLIDNPYLSRTIEVQDKQKVVDKGFYKFVRHPMYTITLLLFLSISLILGSLISFLIFLIYPIIIIKRINNEEKVLEKNLNGYREYQQKVKYKLIPYIW